MGAGGAWGRGYRGYYVGLPSQPSLQAVALLYFMRLDGQLARGFGVEGLRKDR